MTISVDLGERSYPIVVTDSYRLLPQQLAAAKLSGGHGWVISHRTLLNRYGPDLFAPLRHQGWTLATVTIPEAETSKSLEMAQRILMTLSRTATMRVPVLFAFGGGVVGDLTGFVAAVFRRGVPYVQLPTTLLAQVDSAIGGKVGVDLPQAKNFAGAFYQPRLVYNNVAVLATLPLRQRRSGLAEVIKCGMIADPTLFRFLEEHLADCLALKPHAVSVLVQRSCRIKAQVVSHDERETTGLRAQLNFGHTLGHALEAATHYQRWTHGEAIAIGMCAAAALSVQLGRCATEHFERLVNLIQRSGLPTHAAGVSRRAVLRALSYDKKFIHGRPRWVLPTRIGQVVVTESIPDAAVERAVATYVGAKEG